MSLEGDVFIQQVAGYIRRHEDVLASGLLAFSSQSGPHGRHQPKDGARPTRIQFSLHHLYYILDRVGFPEDVGPLNVKLDNDDVGLEPTFILFLTPSHKPIDSDTKLISLMGLVKLIVLLASTYFRTMNYSRDPKVISKDIKYLYLVFSKLPCLVLSPKTKVACIAGYEEYPCDTAVPLRLFRNLQVLEIAGYDPNEIFGWHQLSEQLRILVVKKAEKLNDLTHLLFQLVVDDDHGRAAFGASQPPQHHTATAANTAFRRPRLRASTMESLFAPLPERETLRDYTTLAPQKWSHLKQLTVSDTALVSIQAVCFKPLTNIVKLNLLLNLLEEIPAGLHHCRHLKYLNLLDNYIRSCANLPKNLMLLVLLNLNNNRLENAKGLENLSAVEKIDLRRNLFSDLQQLRSLVLLFIKCSKLANLYLAHNPLPKGYRVDLFNLFNGVKYKNQIKIDDLRPGYFELAMLMDAEAAFKNLETFFMHQRPLASSNGVTVGQRRLLVLTVLPRVDNHLFELMQLDNIRKAALPRRVHHQRLKTLDLTLDSLLEPFANLRYLNPGMERDAHGNIRGLNGVPLADYTTTLATPEPAAAPRTLPLPLLLPKELRRYDLGHTVVSTSPTVLQESSSMYELAAITRSSPLASSQRPNLEVPASNPAAHIKRLLTFTVVDSTTAPSILTPVQVTARMSSS